MLDGALAERVRDGVPVRRLRRRCGRLPLGARSRGPPIVADGLVKAGGFDEGERELRHLSDDQAICVGHAVRNRAHGLPAARALAGAPDRPRVASACAWPAARGTSVPMPRSSCTATPIARTAAFRPVLVSISLNHHAGSDWLLLRSIAEEAMETACVGMPLPDLVLNGAGMFVCGGPNGDNGLSGKKLVVDAYGPGVPIGGGAWSGKDFLKVDRLGGMAARRIALESLLASDAHTAIGDAHVPARRRSAVTRRPAARWAAFGESGRACRVRCAGDCAAAPAAGSKNRLGRARAVGASGARHAVGTAVAADEPTQTAGRGDESYGAYLRRAGERQSGVLPPAARSALVP